MNGVPLTPAEDEAARRLAGEILSRGEFSGAKQMLDLAEQAIEWIRWLLGWGELATTNPPLYYTILFGLGAFAAALIAHLVVSIRAALVLQGREKPAAVRAADPHFADEADRLAGQGRFLEAAHRLQLGVLDLLLRGRRLELARSEPNRVLRRRLAEARIGEAERHDLGLLLDRFETRWFRDREEDPSLYEAWRSLYRRLARGNATA